MTIPAAAIGGLMGGSECTCGHSFEVHEDNGAAFPDTMYRCTTCLDCVLNAGLEGCDPEDFEPDAYAVTFD